MNSGTGRFGKRRRRLAAIVAALLGVVGVATWLLRPPASPTARNDTKPAATTADAKHSGNAGASAEATDTAETSASRAPTVASITPEEFAKAWQARALKTIRNKNARLLGEEVADLLALPADKAWAALTQRARDGDQDAAAAALELAEACQALRAWNAGEGKNTPLFAMDASSRSRMDAVARLLRQWSLKRGNDCAKITGMAEFVQFATDRFVRDDDPATRRDAATSIDDEDAAIAAMRSLMSADQSDDLRRALGARLSLSADPQRRAEGRALLEALARNGDIDALVWLAACHEPDCSASSLRTWQEHAAALGIWSALDRQVEDFTNAQDSIDAWAWTQYRLLLAQDACFEHLEPSSTWLAEALRAANHLQGKLTPAQRAEGEALLRRLIAQWSAQAHAAQGCG